MERHLLAAACLASSESDLSERCSAVLVSQGERPVGEPNAGALSRSPVLYALQHIPKRCYRRTVPKRLVRDPTRLLINSKQQRYACVQERSAALRVDIEEPTEALWA